MVTLLNYLNLFFTKLFSYLMLPVARLSPEQALTLISILLGILLLLIYGKISNQEKIRATKQKIYGYLLESILFRQSLKASLFAQARMFVAGIKYFLLALGPVMILMIPCIFILAQLNLWFGVRGLNPGETSIIKIVTKAPEDLYKLELRSSPNLEVTPPIRIPENNEVFWRVKPLEQKIAPLAIKLAGSAEVIKEIKLNSRLSPIATDWKDSFWGRLLYPATPKNIKFIKELVVTYPTIEYNFFGLKFNWLIFFLVVSLISGLLASRIFKVEV